ncbi:fibronectin type III domain-containing protein [Allokutzneria sp. NRRL B-24872]|uniref:fibronectin type III domain-containing protein n=1 Tax=Allokutzneria sp. NRRL B-24872 TaxID=1137961 RepID=UPI00352E6164
MPPNVQARPTGPTTAAIWWTAVPNAPSTARYWYRALRPMPSEWRSQTTTSVVLSKLSPGVSYTYQIQYCRNSATACEPTQSVTFST